MLDDVDSVYISCLGIVIESLKVIFDLHAGNTLAIKRWLEIATHALSRARQYGGLIISSTPRREYRWLLTLVIERRLVFRSNHRVPIVDGVP